MKQISRKYTNTTIIGRVVAIIAAILFVVFMIAKINSGQKPEDFSEYINAKGSQALALRDWMIENDIDSICLMNKSNRNNANGVSMQVGKLYCIFDGPGTDALFSPVKFEDYTKAADKAFELEEIAREYGAYAYYRHEDTFEVIISGDPVRRLGGMEGTSVFYSEQPINKTEMQTEVSSVEDLGNGWFMAEANGQSVHNEQININPQLLKIMVIVIAFIIILLILPLLYKKCGCNAQVIDKNSERMVQSRYFYWIRGIRGGPFEGYTVYKVTFLTDQNERISIYMQKKEYDRLHLNAYGYLEYKRLWIRYKFLSYRVTKES